jgi:hypothetical protein
MVSPMGARDNGCVGEEDALGQIAVPPGICAETSPNIARLAGFCIGFDTDSVEIRRLLLTVADSLGCFGDSSDVAVSLTRAGTGADSLTSKSSVESQRRKSRSS